MTRRSRAQRHRGRHRSRLLRGGAVLSQGPRGQIVEEQLVDYSAEQFRTKVNELGILNKKGIAMAVRDTNHPEIDAAAPS